MPRFTLKLVALIVLGSLIVTGAAIPAAAATTYYVSPDGDDAATGTSRRQPFQSLQHALDLAQPGDTIRLAPGVYREDVVTRRDGTARAPITITGPTTAVLQGAGTSSRIFQVHHDHYTLRGFTIDGLHGDPNQRDGYRDKLLYVIGIEPLNGVTGLLVDRMTFQNAGGECLRLRYFATDNEIKRSTFTNCGVYDFQFDDGGKNGEGIYIGTSNKQWGENGAPTAHVDATNNNWVHHNRFDTQGNECVDIKEGATGNIVEHNRCTGQQDPESGGFDSRGDGNVFRDNLSYGNVGAGIRLGGAEVDGHQYGQGNDVYRNVIRDNEAGGIKFMVKPQGKVCENVMNNNVGGAAVGEYGDEFDPAQRCPGRPGRR